MIRLLLLDAQVGSPTTCAYSILRLSRPDIPTVISGTCSERIRAMFATEHYNAFLQAPQYATNLKPCSRTFARHRDLLCLCHVLGAP